MKKFTVTTRALDLYDHTTKLLANEKNFDRTYKDLIDKLHMEAAMIYHCLRTANEDLDNRVQEEAKERIVLQGEAIKRCKWIKTYIMLSARVFHLRAKRVVYWTKLVNRVMELAKEWRKSEIRKYKETWAVGC